MIRAAALVRSPRQAGIGLCLVSAIGFGSMAVLAKLAYDSGASVATVLSVRFGLAAAVLWLLVARPWSAGVRDRLPGRRAAVAGMALGAVLYAAESGLFFLALTRMDASLAELALFSYPAMLVVGAVIIGRERASRRRFGALTLAIAGVVLVLVAGGTTSGLDGVGAALAIAAAAGYATYVLIADTLSGDVRPMALAALVCTGAFASFTVGGAATGNLSLAFGGEAWLFMASIAVVSTVIPLSAFLASVERIGPSNAAIISTFEPVITLGLAFLLLGDRLTPPQLVGGALVLAAVAVLNVRQGGADSRGELQRPAAAPA